MNSESKKRKEIEDEIYYKNLRNQLRVKKSSSIVDEDDGLLVASSGFIASAIIGSLF